MNTVSNHSKDLAMKYALRLLALMGPYLPPNGKQVHVAECPPPTTSPQWQNRPTCDHYRRFVVKTRQGVVSLRQVCRPTLRSGESRGTVGALGARLGPPFPACCSEIGSRRLPGIGIT